MAITKTLGTLTTPVPSIQTQTQTAFSENADNAFIYLGDLAPDINIFTGQANALAVEVNTDAATASSAALTAANVSGLAKYKGAWLAGSTYALGESVLNNGIYYISDIASNVGNTPADDANWSSISGTFSAWTPISTSSTIKANTKYSVDFGVSPLTLTLPLTPAVNDFVEFYKSAGASLDSIIARNGETIMGLTEDLTIDTEVNSLKLIYNGTDWRLS